MRWLVGLLLLANLCLFLWQYDSAPSGDAVSRDVAPTDPGVAPVVVLHKGPPVVRPAPGTTLPASPRLAEKAPPAGLPTPSKQPVAEPSASGGGSAPPPPVAADARPAPQSVAAPAAAKSQLPLPAAPQPPPSAPPEPIAARSPPAPAATPPHRRSVVTPPIQCVRLGPFAEEHSARSARDALRARGVAARLAKESSVVEARYWVHLPPAGSYAAARRRLAELQRKRIDSFIVSRGEFRDAISLGVFSTHAAAERLLKEMRARGYDAHLSERDHSITRFWLELGPRASARLTAPMEAMLRHRFGTSEVQRRSCP